MLAPSPQLASSSPSSTPSLLFFITTITIHIVITINYALTITTINIFITLIITTTMPLTFTTTFTITIIIINITTIIISISTIIIIIITSIISTTIITKFLIITTTIISISIIIILLIPALLSISPSSLLKTSLSPSIKLMIFCFLIASLCSFIENLLLYVNGFLKMLFSLIELSRFVFAGIFVTVCLSVILLLPKQFILKQKKSAKQRKYKNRQKACPTFCIYVTLCL